MKWLRALWVFIYALAVFDLSLLSFEAVVTPLAVERAFAIIGGIGAALIAGGSIAKLVDMDAFATDADAESPLFWLRMVYFGARNWRRRRMWRWAWTIEANGAQPAGPYR